MNALAAAVTPIMKLLVATAAFALFAISVYARVQVKVEIGYASGLSEFVIETRGREHSAQIVASLRAQGVKLTLLD